MPLKSARQYYVGPEMTVSPLWRRIATTFQRTFLVQVGDATYDDDHVYVRERHIEATAELGPALDEQDVVDYVEGPRKRLAIVVAPAGLGKTTFLRHALKPYLTRPGFAVIWLDLLRDLPLPDVAHIDVQVAALISAALGRVLGDTPESSSGWQSFFLAHCADSSGVARMLLEEWQTTGTLRPASQDSLQYLMRAAESALAELIRLRFGYLRSELGRTPVVVIDNVDQLPALALEAIARLGFALAEGPNTVVRPDADVESAKVIIAMRPLGGSIAQRAVGTVLRGVLPPPDIAQVIRHRIKEFLEAHKPKILPAGTVSLAPGHALQVNELVDAGPGEPSERSARELLERTVDVLLSDTPKYGQLAHLVLKLNNYNTRVCLLATAGYVASGHIDWTGIFRAIHQDHRNLGSFLSWPKVLRAMFLGVRTTIGSDNPDAWLWNMFNDGEPDRLSAVIRPRLLKLLESKKDGLPTARLVDVFSRLFGYPADRVNGVAAEARDRGLIHEKVAEQLALTGAGLTYLKRMSCEFEYLQHVVIDAWVDNDHLVKCISAEEAPGLRCERVLQFADYVRDIEVRDYARVLRNDAEDLYDRYFGEDTLSSSLCGSLLDADRLAAAMSPDQWTKLVDRARDQQARSTFARIRDAAIERLENRDRPDSKDWGPALDVSTT